MPATATLIPIGRFVLTMCYGHIIVAKVEGHGSDEVGDYLLCRFSHHFSSGTKRLCLDFGAQVNADETYTFRCRQMQRDRALEHVAAGAHG